MRPIKFKYYVLLITFFNILYWANCAAQESDNKKIDQIRQWYMEINKNRDSFTKVVDNDINVYKDLNPQKYSFESTEIYRLALINLERWFSDRKLVKAIVTFDGDRENLTSEYYFHDQRLFFVFKNKIEYHEPKWDKAFDATKKTILENRFYFDDDKLIRWIDSDQNIRKSTDAEFKKRERQILSDAALYREIKYKVQETSKKLETTDTNNSRSDRERLQSPYRISKRTVPEDFKQAYEFLEFIKFPEERYGSFEPQAAPHWDLTTFLSFISVNGVEFSDVNGRLTGHRTPALIKSELSKRKGDIFVTFSHLAHIYSEPYKQYSELTFEKRDKGYVVNVSDWYRLTFLSEGGRLRLVKCDYRMLEGD